jgi:dTDP-4-dehydrorhamnose reductase
MKCVLVIGGNGMLGHKLVQRLGDKGLDVWTTLHSTFDEVERFGIFDRERTIETIDVTGIDSVKKAVDTAEPDVIINAVGVIKQSREATDIANTLLINSIFPHRLAKTANEAGARLILISTDCVFDGKDGNYTENDDPNALDLYGQSKRWGEVTADNCLTVRTSIIGRELSGAHSLVEWFLSNRGGSVKGYANAIYSGFPTIVFADIISSLINEHTGLSGLYHISSEPIDKFTLLTLINDAYDAGISVEPDEEFRIDRSLDSTRFRKATGFEPPSWEAMIGQMAADTTPYDEFRR